MIEAATDVDQIREAIRGCPPGQRLLPVAGATKPALSHITDADTVNLDVSDLRGIVSYDPAELTFTARAGTPLAEIGATLAEHGQYLPFDPPLVQAGATLGGAIAAGASGPGALRYGGVRDFVIGVRFVDGTARLVAGGGRVVKNAAGFDFPKLMVGSIGRLGVLVEASIKVFPCARATLTLAHAVASPQAAIATTVALARAPIDLEALDLAPDGTVLARLGGDPELLDVRATRLAALLDGDARRIAGDEERALWADAAALSWVPAGSCIVRVPVTVASAGPVVAWATREGAAARLSLACNVAWIACGDAQLGSLDATLAELGLTGVVLGGTTPTPLLGHTDRGGEFAARVRRALDPLGRFATL